MISKRIILGVIGLGIFTAGAVTSQNIKLNPIKPGVKLSAQLSDEQQAILAVRKAKASVVNIFGEKVVYTVNGAPGAIEPVAGTGVIISADGYIVSNSHVVSQKDTEYRVVLINGSEYEAKIVGLDKNNDVALLKIEAKNLTSASLGNSDDLETGQTVFAIGNSLGVYQNSVSRGVVSGIGRAVNFSEQNLPKPRLLNLIQTDAAISPGNSGGPLINLAGEVIGINTLIETSGQSLGFAVSINTVKSSVEQLKKFGKVAKPYLGIAYQTITKSVVKLRQLKLNKGAYVMEVVGEGPAGRAGILPGDIIQKINQTNLSEQTELDNVIMQFNPGDTVLMTVWRDGQTFETPVLLGEYK
jgi:S1-C subfamily serine protease